MTQRRRSIVWTPTWNPRHRGQGIEHVVMGETEARGTLIAFYDDTPHTLHYRILWDEAWHVRAARIKVQGSDGAKRLHLDADGEGTWRDHTGERLVDLDGCMDLDIWPTPFTNVLAIRRLALEPGERRETRVAYVTAPGLECQSATQAYTRTAARRYRFEALDSAFETEFDVDDDGVVMDYPDLSERES